MIMQPEPASTHWSLTEARNEAGWTQQDATGLDGPQEHNRWLGPSWWLHSSTSASSFGFLGSFLLQVKRKRK